MPGTDHTFLSLSGWTVTSEPEPNHSVFLPPEMRLATPSTSHPWQGTATTGKPSRVLEPPSTTSSMFASLCLLRLARVRDNSQWAHGLGEDRVGAGFLEDALAMKWQKESYKGLMTDPWDGLAEVPVEGAAGSIVTLCEIRSQRWVEVIMVVADSSRTGDSGGETEVECMPSRFTKSNVGRALLHVRPWAPLPSLPMPGRPVTVWSATGLSSSMRWD